MMKTSSLGKETFRCRVRAFGLDPTNGTVEFAFPVAGANPAVWNAGAWTVDVSYNEAAEVYSAVAQTPSVGAGAAGATVVVAAGSYDVWVRVTTAGEIIVRRVDTLLVT